MYILLNIWFYRFFFLKFMHSINSVLFVRAGYVLITAKNGFAIVLLAQQIIWFSRLKAVKPNVVGYKFINCGESMFRKFQFKKLHLFFIVLVLPNVIFSEEISEIRIGLMTELTGPWVAGSGSHCKRGYELARKTLVKNGKLNDTPIKFIYGDTQGKGKPSVTEFKRLVEVEKVQAVVVNRSLAGMAINPISKRLKIPLVGIVGHNKFISENPYSFRTWPSTQLEGSTLAKEVFKQGFRLISAVTIEDEWTISFRDEFIKTFESLGGEIVFNESVLGEDRDFSTLVTKIKSNKSDSILVNLGPTQTGTFIKKVNEFALKKQLFGNYYVRNKETLKEAGVKAVEGLVFVEVKLDKPKFRKALLENFNDEVLNQYKYTCFAGVRSVLQAIQNAKSISNKSELHESLKSLTSVNIFGEDVNVSNREIIHSLAVKKYSEGLVVDAS